MAAVPTPPSIVLKTGSPTAAQTAQINSATPPSYKPGNTGLNAGPSAPWLGQHYGLRVQIPKAVKTTAQGFVKSPVQSALSHFVKTSAAAAKDPNAYGSRAKSAPVSSHTPVIPHGNPADAAAAVGSSSGSSSPPRTIAGVDPYTTFSNQGSNIGTMIDPNLANKIAAGQFDPSINSFAQQIQQLPGQITQNKTDITNWLDQVLSSLDTAKTRNDTAFNDAGTSSGASAAGIIASLGGAAMGGSNALAQQGTNQQNMLSALSANNDMFANDMKPIIQLEKSGQLSKQDASQMALMQSLKDSLATAQGAKASTAAQEGLTIQGQNNALAQQRFQNAFGVKQQQDANAAAMAAGLLNSTYKNAQIDHINASTNAINTKAAAGPPAPKGSYGATSAQARQGIASNIVNAVQAAKAAHPTMGAATIVNLVNSMLGQVGWGKTDPKVIAFRNNLFTALGVDPHTQGIATTP